MARPTYTVRVVLFDHNRNTEMDTLIECLHYAGLVSIIKDDEHSLCFDICCPSGLNSLVWAEQNADRMRSFGYNAVVAPSM